MKYLGINIVLIGLNVNNRGETQGRMEDGHPTLKGVEY